jgi:hypothetical protein
MHLVYCSDNQVFNKDKLRDKLWSSRYPGSGWLTCLYETAKENKITVASGDVALKNIQENKWDVNDVYIINEMHSEVASKLLNLGCKPLVITCGESPLYASSFYDNISKHSKNFFVRLGFGFKASSKDDLCEPFFFPSYFLSDIQEPVVWQDRKTIVFIASNKYYSNQLYLSWPLKPINLLRQLKFQLKKNISLSYKSALKKSLLDKRLSTLGYFLDVASIDIYGPNWADLSNLPIAWSNRYKNALSKAYFGLCDNKLQTLSMYKFAICFENIAEDFYVTEKIIDCFVAGTIPIYLGAPNIIDIIPPNSYIDVNKFRNINELDAYLKTITEAEANKIIDNGRLYLASKQGKLHSYEHFAENIIRIIKSC